MLRPLAAVVLGYLVVVAVIMVSFTLLWTLMGQETAFRPGTTEVTWAWLAATLPLNLAAAVAGGATAAWVARSRALAGVLGLAGLMLVLGVAMALGQTGTPTSDAAITASAQLTAFEAAAHARQPTWAAWMFPIVGMTGALIGGGLVALRRARRGRMIQGAHASVST